MAADFQMFFHRTQESLHLKLDGDFDVCSAHRLLRAIEEQGAGLYQIFIDTNDLKTVFPRGRRAFRQYLGALEKKAGNLIFIGDNEHKISPDWRPV